MQIQPIPHTISVPLPSALMLLCFAHKYCVEVITDCCSLFMVHKQKLWGQDHVPLQQPQQLLKATPVPLRELCSGSTEKAWKGRCPSSLERKEMAGLGGGWK